MLLQETFLEPPQQFPLLLTLQCLSPKTCAPVPKKSTNANGRGAGELQLKREFISYLYITITKHLKKEKGNPPSTTGCIFDPPQTHMNNNLLII